MERKGKPQAQGGIIILERSIVITRSDCRKPVNGQFLNTFVCNANQTLSNKHLQKIVEQKI